MGTRHLTCVVQNGEYRVAQYGQWDGYPDGQGETVVAFLTGSDLRQFRQQVSKVRHVTSDEANRKLVSDDGTCPFSRDMGAGILRHIQNTNAPEVFMSLDFAADSLFCEWAYVVDLDHDTLEVYRGFNKEPLPEGERFRFLEQKSERGYHPVKLFAKIPFVELGPESMSILEKQTREDAPPEEK